MSDIVDGPKGNAELGDDEQEADEDVQEMEDDLLDIVDSALGGLNILYDNLRNVRRTHASTVMDAQAIAQAYGAIDEANDLVQRLVEIYEERKPPEEPPPKPKRRRKR